MKYSRRDFVGRSFTLVGGVTAAALVGSQAAALAAPKPSVKLSEHSASKTIDFEHWLLSTLPA